jgi:hypothetical protein
MIAVEAARSLTGIDLVRQIMHREIPPPPIFNLIDFRLTNVEPGEVSGEFQPAEFHYNPMGGVDGGVISTLLDSVMGLSVLTQLPPRCTWSRAIRRGATSGPPSSPAAARGSASPSSPRAPTWWLLATLRNPRKLAETQG